MVDFSLIHPRAHEDLGGEIPFESAEAYDEGFGQDLNPRVPINPNNQLLKEILYICAFNGFFYFQGKAAQARFLFNDNHFESLFRKTQGGGHAGDTPPRSPGHVC